LWEFKALPITVNGSLGQSRTVRFVPGISCVPCERTPGQWHWALALQSLTCPGPPKIPVAKPHRNRAKITTLTLLAIASVLQPNRRGITEIIRVLRRPK